MSPSQHNKTCQIGYTNMRNEGKTQAVEVFRGNEVRIFQLQFHWDQKPR
jgi:hypothetical protein